jgi:hypothetical protein
MSMRKNEISEKVKLAALKGGACGARAGPEISDYTDYKTITRIANALKQIGGRGGFSLPGYRLRRLNRNIIDG